MFHFQYVSIPIVVAVVLATAVMALAMATRFKWTILVVATMFFVASVGLRAVRLEGGGLTEIRQLWVFPLQVNRSGAFLILGLLLFVGIISHYHRTTSVVGRPTQAMMLLAIGLYSGFLRMFHEAPVLGLQSMSFALITLVPLILVIPALLREPNGFLMIIRALLVTNIVWIAAVAVQIVINRNMVADGPISRFYGLTGNAQHAAAYLAIIAVIQLWILVYHPRQRFKILWYAWTGLNIVMLAWTGSRTGAGMFVIGTCAALYGRLGRTVLMFPLVAVALGGMLYLASLLNVNVGDAAENLTSLQDTRTAAWGKQVAAGFAHPLVGVGAHETRSENSYLYGVSAYGIGMGVLLLMLLAISARIVWKLYRLRHHLDLQQRALADLVISFNAMYFSSSMLDGHIMARVGPPTVLMIIFSAKAAQMLSEFANDAADEDIESPELSPEELAYEYASPEEYPEGDAGQGRW